MTSIQKEAVKRNPTVLIFHMILKRGDDDGCLQEPQYASLGEEWDALHESIPTMKYTRIITAEELRPGEFLLVCSCGFDFRYQGTCRHLSLLLLHASNGECAGCEIGNIALRNTAAFAACRDEKLIKRTPCDWKGILCGHVTEESLRNCPCNDGADDQDGQDNHDDHEDGDVQERRTSQRKISEAAQWRQMHEVELTKIQDHYYRVKAKLLSCEKEEFFERARKVDAHILEAFQELSDVQDVPQSTVANRYRDDPKRGQRAKNPPLRPAAPPPHKRQAAAGGGCCATSAIYTPAAAGKTGYAVIHLSDSDELEMFEDENRGGGASSPE
jgi:hypothetical protein